MKSLNELAFFIRMRIFDLVPSQKHLEDWQSTCYILPEIKEIIQS